VDWSLAPPRAVSDGGVFSSSKKRIDRLELGTWGKGKKTSKLLMVDLVLQKNRGNMWKKSGKSKVAAMKKKGGKGGEAFVPQGPFGEGMLFRGCRAEGNCNHRKVWVTDG